MSTSLLPAFSRLALCGGVRPASTARRSVVLVGVNQHAPGASAHPSHPRSRTASSLALAPYDPLNRRRASGSLRPTTPAHSHSPVSASPSLSTSSRESFVRGLRFASRRASTAAAATKVEGGGSRLKLGALSPATGRKNRKRLGRGIGSGRGGTSTRGHKGQKARSGNGKPVPGFEGGQTPIMRRYPKRGFTNIHGKDMAPVNVDRIQAWIDRDLLDATKPITARELLESRCIHKVKDGVKVLGDGARFLRTPVHLVVSRASASAIEAIEAVGGSVETRYYNALTLRHLVKPNAALGSVPPRPANPTTKRDLLYYSDWKNRGYLAKEAMLRAATTGTSGEGLGGTADDASAPSVAAATGEETPAPREAKA